MFAIDLRTLAFFRIFISLILIFDLVDRSFYLAEHYSDWGVMPLEALPFNQKFLWMHSIHAISGNAAFVGTIFLLNGVFAVCLLIGYRTWLMNFLCWILLCSLFNRNSVVLSGADALLRALLFWSLFLPLGAYFSVDRTRNRGTEPLPKTVFSGGSVAILLQVCFMYWFSFIYKWNPDWIHGKALYYALNIDQFVTDWGKWLRLHEWTMEGLTYLTLVFEAVAPVLVLLPLKNSGLRTATVFTMILLHISFGAMLYLGIFSYVVIAGWLLFLPSAFWDRLFKFFNINEDWSDQVLSDYPILPRKLGNLLALFILANVFLWNIFLVSGKFVEEIPLVPRVVTKLFMIEQNWNMFSRPLRQDGWFVIVGKLISGKIVEISKNGASLDWKKPADVANTYPNSRWRKYMMNLTVAETARYLPYYCKWWCRNWNKDHFSDSQLEIIQVIFMVEKTEENQIDRPERVVLYTHYCN